MPSITFSNTLLLLILSISTVNAGEIVFRDRGHFALRAQTHALAIDHRYLYLASEKTIQTIDKTTKQPIRRWQSKKEATFGQIKDVVISHGNLFCLHCKLESNSRPHYLTTFSPASLTPTSTQALLNFDEIYWIDRFEGSWWIACGHRRLADSVTVQLVRLDDEWQPIGKWTFPKKLALDWKDRTDGTFGPNGRLVVADVDDGCLHLFRKPELNQELHRIQKMKLPASGPLAWDRSDIGTLYGITDGGKKLVTMRLSHADEYTELAQPVTWKRHPKNPVLPPRRGDHFDATRCMNPWVVREQQEYHLYYSGGSSEGVQRIGVASAPIDDLTQWSRTGPLFENGASGTFDARWCVLPHILRIDKNLWHLYYTGNAGSGTGLSAFPGMGLAISHDGKSWSRHSDSPVLSRSEQPGSPDAIGVAGGSVIQVSLPDGSIQWRFYYTGCPTVGKTHELDQQKTICLATSNDGIQWTKMGAILLRDPDRDYENIGVAGPVVLRENDGLFRMWYSAIGSRHGYYSICYAESEDGIYWRRGEKPGDNLQLLPTKGWESQMVEYPSVIREGDRLRLFYCGNGYGRTGIGTAVSE